MAIVDLIIILFVLAMAAFGFIKGFIKSLISLLGFIISLALAILLAKVVANALLSIDTIGGFVAGDKSLFSFLFKKLPESLEAITTEQLIKYGPKTKELFSQEAPWFLRMFYPLVSSGLSNPAYLNSLENARQIMALELAYGVYTLIVGITLFIMFRIVSEVISLVFEKYTKGKKLFFGRVAGAIIGAGKGVIYTMIILTLFSFLVNFSFMTHLNEELERSKTAAFLSGATLKVTSSLLESKDDDPRYQRLLEAAGFNQE